MKLFTIIILTLFVSCRAKKNGNVIVDYSTSLVNKSESIITYKKLDISQFVPDGYSILDSASGHLNKDQTQDLILILNKIDEQSISDIIDNPTHRPLLVLLNQENNSYVLASRGDSAVYCCDCGGIVGDPYQGLTIKDYSFIIYHYGGSRWRWSRNLTFSYSESDQNWILIADENSSFDSFDPDKVETTIFTPKDFGSLSLKGFNIYRGQ
jgi:hypothetical protein